MLGGFVQNEFPTCGQPALIPSGSRREGESSQGP